MKKSTKKEDKLCFILHTISSILFLFSGILIFINDGFSNMMCITDLGLSITFGSLAIIYYKKYKKEDK